MKTVRISDGKVVEILEPVPGFTLAQCFHPSVLAACVAAEDSVSVGDDWPPPVIEPVVETPADPAADQPPAEPTTV